MKRPPCAGRPGRPQSGQSGSLLCRDAAGQGTGAWPHSQTVKPWARGTGQGCGLCPLGGQSLLPACGLSSWTHSWGSAPRPGLACQGPAGCHLRRQGREGLCLGGPWGSGMRSQTAPASQLGFLLWPCALLPAKELSAQPLPTAVPREAPGLEETKAAGTYLGCKEGVGRGRGTPLTPGSRASRAAGPGPPSSAPLPQPQRSLPSWCSGGRGRACARVRVRVCACVPPVHCSISAPRRAPPSRRRRSLAGSGSAWRRAPAPPFPSRPASPHLLPAFKGPARLP